MPIGQMQFWMKRDTIIFAQPNKFKSGGLLESCS